MTRRGDRSGAGSDARPPEAIVALFDREVPMLVVKQGHYPLGHGGLGVVRSMGRLGVPVVAMVEDVLTPLGASRYLDARVPPLTLDMDADAVVAAVTDAARVAALLVGRPGVRPVCVATDDEAAIVLAEQQDRLGEVVRLPQVPPELPRTLASKDGLARTCERLGMPTPRTLAPESREQVVEFADSARFPVVVKNREAFTRALSPALTGSRVLARPEDLLVWAAGYQPSHPAVVQEYVPVEHATSWIYHAYRAVDGEVLSFIAVKHRDWPRHRGATTLAESRDNPELQALGDALLTRTGYRGVADLDYVRDERDGRYLLLDFNPRFGANSALSVTTTGIDLARAVHLDLTGRPIPPGGPAAGVWFVDELRDHRARRADAAPVHPPAGATVRRSFWAADDPAPAAVARARVPMLTTRGHVLRALRRRGTSSPGT